ncbi:DUF6056 family protein [Streptomyces sp. NPDC020965]|uniref:DUF6056 family protein n=1 Tax=Streptomyces sp. NPDC020965 TaxID=3365105 RepID=UPI00378FE69E
MAVDTSKTEIAPEPEREDNGSPGGRSGKPWRSWPLALSLLPLGLLALASAYGRHVRPSGDDWCFLPHTRDHGVAGMVDKFYSLDNGRVGNGVLVGLYAKYPIGGHQWFGLLSGVLMLALLWAVTVALLRRAELRVPRGIPLLVAAMITAVFLFASANTYKTFFWPAASVSHTLAPVLAAAAVVPLLLARGRGGWVAALVTVVVTGVFLGTLSEEASVVGLVVLAALVLFAHRLFVERVRRGVRLWSLAGMVGIAIGTLVLVTSPGSRNRRERFDADRVSMLAPESLAGSLWGFVEIMARVALQWQYLGALAAGVLLGLVARRGGGDRAPVFLPVRPLPLLALGAVVFLICGYLCTVITYPVFGERVVTTERTWNDYLLLYVFLLAGAGALLGRRLRDRERSSGLLVAAMVATAVSVLGMVVPLVELGDQMRVRADQWERQDAYLKQGAANGEKVLPYTPTRVGRMLEPFAKKGTKVWPAQCVADWYDLDRVTYAERAVYPERAR